MRNSSAPIRARIRSSGSDHWNSLTPNHVENPSMDSATAPPAQDSKRILSAILAIVLPGVGVHKFILGMTTPGLIYLLTLFFCGAFGGITIVLSIIEGII